MLTSSKNPFVKQIRKLHRAKYRRSLQQFLLEGTHLIQEAIATQYPLQAVCVTEHWKARYPNEWGYLRAVTERQETVSTEVMEAISTTVTPDGVVAIGPQPLFSIQPQTPPTLGIALEALQDPGNVGTLIRTAAAVGSDGLWVSRESVDLTHPKVLRASAGQWFRLSKYVTPDLGSELSRWKARGCRVLATAADAVVPYWAVDFTEPTVLVFGNEGAGLSPEVTSMTSQVISIPTVNQVESLNVGVAAAVILFEALRQRQYSNQL